MSLLRLAGGRVCDPATGRQDAADDVWICGDRVVAAPSKPASVECTTIDCSGRVLMPGGIDMHSHIVGPKVNAARRLQPELLSGPTGSSTGCILPSLHEAAANYLTMGYTTVMDAAIAPSASRLVHRELEQIAGIDVGFYLLAANHEFVLQSVAKNDRVALENFLSWLLRRGGAWAVKLVNPGGVALWKRGANGNARDLDQIIDGWSTSPSQIIRRVAEAANRLGFPHPIHLHGLNLGLAGNWQTTFNTLQLLDGLKAHLAHVQFHSYGGADPNEDPFASKVEPLAEWLNAHPEITVDVGQIVFGSTTTMTADAPLGHALARMNNHKWFSHDLEIETGCGISPITYKEKNKIHAWQWTIGLEWLLRVTNPWQIALTTDHPNGGSFLSYPRLIKLLMDREFRREALQRLPKSVREKSPLRELNREYTLSEIAIITRAAPARILGLSRRGSLAVGAVADIAIYTPQADKEIMFQVPWMVIKSGSVACEQGELRSLPRGSTLSVGAQADGDWERWFAGWVRQNYSYRIEHFGRGDDTSPGFSRRLEREEIASSC